MNSDHVKKRRNKLKLLAVDYKGGKCQKCGYDRCARALEFHHLDPKQKQFGIASKGLTRSWDRLKPELDKTVLLCANCHRETEQELRMSGDTLARGAKSAQFFTPGGGTPDLKNVAPDGTRETFFPKLDKKPKKVEKGRPLYDRLIVRRDPAEEVSANGIFLPTAAQDSVYKGTVLAIGHGRMENGQVIPLIVKVNDRVLFNKYAGVEVKYNGEDVLILREEDVLMTLS